MLIRTKFFILLIFQLISKCLSSSCGDAAIPFSFEALPEGLPVLGCARPSCFGWTLDGKPAGSPSSFYRVNHKPDGYVRSTFNVTFRNTNLVNFTAPISKCSQSFEKPSCNQNNEEWVGGIAPLLNVSLYPLALQCCSYSKLKRSQDRGIATVNSGQMVLGGEVYENGRQYAFDYISNIEKKKHDNGSVYYEVYMRRMQCLPYPKEFSIRVEDKMIESLINKAMAFELKPIETYDQFSKLHIGAVHIPKPMHSGNVFMFDKSKYNATTSTSVPKNTTDIIITTTGVYEFIQGPFDGEDDLVTASGINQDITTILPGNQIKPQKIASSGVKIKDVHEQTPISNPKNHILDGTSLNPSTEAPPNDFQEFYLQKNYFQRMDELDKMSQFLQKELKDEEISGQTHEELKDEGISKQTQDEAIEEENEKLSQFLQNELLEEEISIQAQEEAIEEEQEKMKAENPTFVPSKSILHEGAAINNLGKPKAYHAPTYNVEYGKYCECCGSEQCDCCVIIEQPSQVQVQPASGSSSCGCCGQTSCGCCPASPGFYCFSGDTRVQTIDGKIKKMNELEVGDWVLTVNDLETIYTPIESWTHRMPNDVQEFLLFTLEDGRKLKITSKHFIYKTKCTNPNIHLPINQISKHLVFAEKVEIGDCLYVHYSKNSLVQRRVKDIQIVKSKGIYAPMTATGDIIVDGIYASCYTVLHNTEIQYSFFKMLESLPSVNSILGINNEIKNEYDLPIGIRWLLELMEFLIPSDILI